MKVLIVILFVSYIATADKGARLWREKKYAPCNIVALFDKGKAHMYVTIRNIAKLRSAKGETDMEILYSGPKAFYAFLEEKSSGITYTIGKQTLKTHHYHQNK